MTGTRQTSSQDARPDNREAEDENLRRQPGPDGEPRPATEPKGAKQSQESGSTALDPGSGRPNPGGKPSGIGKDPGQPQGRRTH